MKLSSYFINLQDHTLFFRACSIGSARNGLECCHEYTAPFESLAVYTYGVGI